MNTNCLRLTFVALLLTMLSGRAAAHELNVAVTPSGSNVVTTSVGVDNAFVASLGYSHAFDALSRTLMLGGDVSLPWAAPDPGDYRLRLRGVVPLVGTGALRLLAEATPGLRGDRNELNRMTSVSLAGNLTGGYYGPHWFAALEVGSDWSAATYIAHSDRFRRTIYADAKDGWYRSTALTVNAGVVGGVSFGAVDLVLRAGQQRDQHLKTLLLPAYLSLGFNARLPL